MSRLIRFLTSRWMIALIIIMSLVAVAIGAWDTYWTYERIGQQVETSWE